MRGATHTCLSITTLYYYIINNIKYLTYTHTHTHTHTQQIQNTNVNDKNDSNFYKKARDDYGIVGHDELHVGKTRKSGLKKRKTKLEPMKIIIARLGDRLSDLKDAFDRQEAGRDGIPASELVKLFWTAGVDDAASTVEEFIQTLDDKRTFIGLDSFLRLYDKHENKMIATMTSTYTYV